MQIEGVLHRVHDPSLLPHVMQYYHPTVVRQFHYKEQKYFTLLMYSLKSSFPAHLYQMGCNGDEHQLSFELKYNMLVVTLVIECLSIKGMPHPIAFQYVVYCFWKCSGALDTSKGSLLKYKPPNSVINVVTRHV